MRLFLSRFQTCLCCAALMFTFGCQLIAKSQQSPKKETVPPASQPSALPPITKAGMTATVGGDLKIQVVSIPAGEFQMGSENGDGDEKPVHRVVLTEPFWMGQYEVTQAQWESVMRNNPSYFRGRDLPVESVSWDECQEFIRKLNANGDGYFYRLPTEAEWEYACRAGTTGEYAGNLDEMAWYKKNSGGQTHPVGQKKPNAWGLYDMHANVWEWCQDLYGTYPIISVTNPTGNPEGSYRVFRGGSWYYRRTGYCGSALRGLYSSGARSDDLGFRIVMARKKRTGF